VAVSCVVMCVRPFCREMVGDFGEDDAPKKKRYDSSDGGAAAGWGDDTVQESSPSKRRRGKAGMQYVTGGEECWV